LPEVGDKYGVAMDTHISAHITQFQLY